MTTTRRVHIVPAIAGQADTLGHLIATAFHDLAVSRWLVADPTDRLRMQGQQFTMLVRHALSYGDVYTTPDATAVAVWMPHDPQLKMPTVHGYARRLAQITGPHLRRFTSLDDAMEEHHPRDSHWYLAFLAVHPDHQGHGIGSALLRYRHLHLDALSTPAFLHASDHRARDLYLRHGYRAVGEEFPVGHDAPTMTPMWRDPGTQLDTMR